MKSLFAKMALQVFVRIDPCSDIERKGSFHRAANVLQAILKIDETLSW